MQPKRLTILGVGLLGGSIGLAVRQRISGCTIAGYGHRTSTLQSAIRLKAIDQAYESARESVQGSDLVILCAPVGLLPKLLAEIGPALAPGALVTDVGSTKRSVVKAAAEHLPDTVRFVGSHPMAGSEKRGVQFARADLFDGALCVVTPTATTPPAVVEQVESFWRALGMRTARLSPEEHDRQVAEISHLPHALAAALVAMQTEESLALAGKGFLDATRIAAGDGALWRDILIDNRDNLRAAITHFQVILEELLARSDPAHGEALKTWLDEAAEKRNRMKIP